jgi:malate dehydrogenase (oxaloacetate-decarboxylating)
VMEGKAILFKRFANVDAWPICLATQDPDEIVRTVELIAPVFGGINLEDIAAPRCFEIEARLRERLSIPVFHDDQHGTAIVVLAALLNALRVVDKSLDAVRVVIVGLGAAGVAIARLLLAEGVKDLVAVDVQGIVTPEDPSLDPARREIALRSNPRRLRGGLEEAMRGADAVIGVSRRGAIAPEHLALMAPRSVVFALANPEPEVDPDVARRYAEVVATGRSDEPNQINNVLVFPGFFRGLLDANAREITLSMERAAAHALAAIVAPEELSPAYIVPTVFNPRVAPAIAEAVASRIEAGA